VTKGLNPNAKMKDSGIEWLGEIPEHWEVARTDSRLATTRMTVSQESLSGQSVFHYSIPAVQLYGTGICEDGDDIDSSKTLITKQTLLVSKLNPRKGTIVLAVPQDQKTVCSGEFVPLIPVDVVPRFAEYVFRSEPVRQLLSSRVESVTKSHQRVNPADICKLRWVWPQVDEQRAIATFLDRETTHIDAMIEQINKSIELLREYRTVIIWAAVTGKIDVREEGS
jgi:type I restriction enzyme, S subunit